MQFCILNTIPGSKTLKNLDFPTFLIGKTEQPFIEVITLFLGFKIFSTAAITAGKNMVYHTTAVGLGIGADVSTEINYIPEKVSHLATSMMSMGAVVIDNNGIFELLDNN